MDRLGNTERNEEDKEQGNEDGGGGVGDNCNGDGKGGGLDGHDRSLDVDIADIDQDKVQRCKGKGVHHEQGGDEGDAGAGAGVDVGSNWRDQDGQPSLYCAAQSRDNSELPSFFPAGLTVTHVSISEAIMIMLGQHTWQRGYDLCPSLKKRSRVQRLSNRSFCYPLFGYRVSGSEWSCCPQHPAR